MDRVSPKFPKFPLAIYALAAVVAYWSCQRESSSPASEGTASDRPIDGVEPVPGYLAEPKNVKMTNTLDGTSIISAGAGTVIASDGRIQDLVVAIWRWDPASSIETISPTERGLIVRRLGGSAVADDGSFAVTITAAPGTTLICGVASNTHARHLVLDSVAESDIPEGGAVNIMKEMDSDEPWTEITTATVDKL
jgi:hypothetical protein